MFDNDWDPLDILIRIQNKVGQMEQNFRQVAVAFNDRGEMIDKQTEIIIELQKRVLELERAVVNQQQRIEQLSIGRMLR